MSNTCVTSKQERENHELRRWRAGIPERFEEFVSKIPTVTKDDIRKTKDKTSERGAERVRLR